MAIEFLHLSSVVRGALVDRDGDRLGRVEDLIARLGFSPHPPVTGAVVAHRPPPAVRARGPHRRPAAGAGGVLGRHREPAALRAPPRRAAAVGGPERPPPDQPAGARLIRANEIELAKVEGRWEVVAVDPAPGWPCGACCRASSDGASRPARSSTGAASSPSWPTCPPPACASPTASWLACTRPRSPTWWRRHRTTRARRSSRRWARTASSRPTCSRSSTPSTSSSSCRAAPTPRRPACSPPWPPTTPPTSSPSWTRSAACPCSASCLGPSSERSGRCSTTTPRQRAVS